MKSKESENILKRIEREVKGSVLSRPIFTRDISVIIPDTSSLMDIVEYTSSYTGVNKNYQTTKSFLENLIVRNRIILVSEEIIRELLSHVERGHNLLRGAKGKFLLNYLFHLDSITKGFLSGVRYGASLSQVAMDVYWTSKLSCKNNKKKSLEDCSDVDKELLKFASLLGTSQTYNKQKINPVYLLSSDEHLIAGTKFLKEKCDYENINCINTRLK